MPENIDSVGIEYEVEDFSPSLSRNLAEHFSTTHDASCERDAKVLNCGLVINNKLDFFAYRNKVLGGEIVSNILDTSDGSYINIIKELTSYVMEEGESPESFRAGIHVHICFSNPNLRMLKSTVRLWRHLEDLFYLLGGMGYEFRGVRNDSTYCRPLTKNGPIIVPTALGNYAESVNLDDLLDARTISDFWTRWGDLHNQGGGRYFPVRYHGFNLSPAYKRGTIEFRVFNKTLNPLFIYSVVEFCKKFAEISMKMDLEDFSALGFTSENSVYNDRGKDDIAQTFLNFCKISRLSDFCREEIMTIIERTPSVNLSSRRILSHLRNVAPHWENSDYLPRFIPKVLVNRPDFVDIHVLRGE